MVNCFLSHSSRDKKGFVEIVARKLEGRCVYDALTFEEGMKTIDEINDRVKESSLFVLFLSNAALESDWVKKELSRASDLLTEGSIKRIYPIIIDPELRHSDERIPEWMRKEYNLKYISRPTVATRRILQRLREISWDLHPRLKEREKIFVGRNDLIKAFEERVDSIDLPTPTCCLAGGFHRIGRKSFLKNCFLKTGIIRDAYVPSLISLNAQESIEDFIYKLHDLGFSEKIDLTEFMTKKIEDKIAIALSLVKDMQKVREILFIEDYGCLINENRQITDWFLKLLEGVKDSQQVTFAVSSSFRLIKHSVLKKDYIFSVEVPELDKGERLGLLKRYAEFEGVEMNAEDYKFFRDLLTGFPEQVYFVVDSIKCMSLPEIKKQSYLIVDFSKERINQLLVKYESVPYALDFLAFLAEFDYIDYDFIFEITGGDLAYSKLLNEFLASAVCELLGANNEYVRLNDVIRDFVRRIRLQMPDIYRDKIKGHLEEFLKTYKTEEKDSFDFFYFLKQGLLSGKEIDAKYLIPSHFVKTMQELYDIHSRYKDVIKLADRVLENEQYMDEHIIKEIRYFLCLSLARLRETRFLAEVQKIKGFDHNFLLAFYYRQTGQFTSAIERLNEALKERPNNAKAKRELVQVLINTHDYERALEHAKQNFISEKNNPYHIQAYLDCLVRQNKGTESIQLMESLLDGLERVKFKSDRAMQMSLTARAQFLAFIKNDEKTALDIVNYAIREYPNLIYPKLQKFDICDKFDNIPGMKEIFRKIRI